MVAVLVVVLSAALVYEHQHVTTPILRQADADPSRVSWKKKNGVTSC